jgi:hypothetical protein
MLMLRFLCVGIVCSMFSKWSPAPLIEAMLAPSKLAHFGSSEVKKGSLASIMSPHALTSTGRSLMLMFMLTLMLMLHPQYAL